MYTVLCKALGGNLNNSNYAKYLKKNRERVMHVVIVTNLNPIQQILIKVLILCSKGNTCTYTQLV